jgi:hypothetical protein
MSIPALHLTGAAILVPRGMKVLQAAPAGEHRTRPCRDTTGRNGKEERDRGGAPIEVGAPACGIIVATSANALTPRHEDLSAGTRARGLSPRGTVSVF